MSGNELIGMVRAVFEWASLVIEVLGAGIIVAGVIKVAITRGTIRYLFKLGQPGAYEDYKHQLGKTLLLGLEFRIYGNICGYKLASLMVVQGWIFEGWQGK